MEKFIEKFKDTIPQRDALAWLQSQLPAPTIREFALIWRGTDRYTKPLTFLNVFKYYRGLPDQVAALDWLQGQISPEMLRDFERIYTAPSPEAIRLAIRWDPQTNSRNRAQASRMCFSSSIWMAASYISPRFAQLFPTDDDWLDEVLRYGDTTSADAQMAALRKCGARATFTQGAGLDDLVEDLQRNKPVAIGVLHRGTVAAPSGGGHWLVIGGVDASRQNFLAFDPYGCLMDSPPYSGAVSRGNGYWLPRAVLDGRWTVEGESDGWAVRFD